MTNRQFRSVLLRVLVFGLVAGTLSVATVPELRAETGREIAAKAFPSVVLLVMHDAHGQPLSIGSGFFVSQNVVATNQHVIEDAASGFAKIVGHEEQHRIAGVVGMDSKRDLVLLQLDNTHAPALPLGNSGQVGVGDKLYAIGNPLGLEGTMSEGIVSGLRTVGADTIIQMTAPISPGSSGGPVLNSNGQVVGVAMATFKTGQNLNFAIPSTYVASLVRNKTALRSLSVVPTSAAGQSILDNLGRPTSEGVVGEKMLWGPMGTYSFSLRNNLAQAVTNVTCLVVFYDTEGDPVDFAMLRYPRRADKGDPIPAGLAKRLGLSDGCMVDTTVKELNQGNSYGQGKPKSRVEFRILDFTIVR